MALPSKPVMEALAVTAVTAVTADLVAPPEDKKYFLKILESLPSTIHTGIQSWRLLLVPVWVVAPFPLLIVVAQVAKVDLLAMAG